MGILIRGSALSLPIASESIDLCYADPPFFSQRNYKQFNDKWNSLDEYLSFMETAVREMHRVLKSTGSFYLHCDWHASHYLKVMCDRVFGYNKFRNEIIWKYFGPTMTKKNWPKKHDTLLFYTKGDTYSFDASATLVAYDEKAAARYDKTDELGRRYKLYPDGRRAYIKEGAATDVLELSFLQGNDPERVGYPTQKPLALLERIIKASSNPGDIVLDPFCGGGTTLLAAAKNRRRFIGVDINPEAIAITKKRIE